MSGLHRFVASPRQVSCPLDDETALLEFESGTYYGLDPIGTRVWQLLQQPRSISEIREALREEYDVDENRCDSDLLAFLGALRTARLVDEVP